MDRNVIVTHRELDRALSQLRRSDFEAAVAPAGGFESTGPESQESLGAKLLMFHRAMREIEQKDDGNGVMTTSPDPLVSSLQSFMAEKAEDKEAVSALGPGGFEATFDSHDLLGWAGSFFHWWGKLVPHAWIDAPPNAVPMPKKLRIGLLADWGTGLYGAPLCASTMKNDSKGFDLLMHLGDVYYSGTEKEVKKRFLPFWPPHARLAHLALNSNHEMYSGGYGYFDVTLPEFAKRSMACKQTASHFALQNDHFLLVGLDSAYADHDFAGNQDHWLSGLMAGAGQRKVILFSHHQPYSLFESQGPKLVNKLQEWLTSNRIFAWYWGHEHRLVIYDRHASWGLHGRCLGHGGMPYFRDKIQGASLVSNDFYRFAGREKNGIRTPSGLVLDGPNPYVEGHEMKYGPNGYVVLELDGPQLLESFHLPNGTKLLEQLVQ